MMYDTAGPQPPEQEPTCFKPVIVPIVEPFYCTNSVVTIRRAWPVFLPEHSVGPPLMAGLLKLCLHLLRDHDNLVTVDRQPVSFMKLMKKFNSYKPIMVMG